MWPSCYAAKKFPVLSDLNYLGLFGNPIGSNPAEPADQQGVIYKITYVPEPATISAALVGVAILVFLRTASASLTRQRMPASY